MKILLIGTSRQPTLNVGSNGLGRHTYDFLEKFNEKNDEVYFFCHKDSMIDLKNTKVLDYENEYNDLEKIIYFIKQNNFDIILDFSHFHLLSKNFHDKNFPIINFIHDEECEYSPPNCLLGNKWQKQKYNTGRVFTTGINLKKYSFYEKKQEYFSFCGKLEYRKGYDIAHQVSKIANIKTIFAGPDVEGNARLLDHWIGEIKDQKELCEFIGNSKCLFYPSRSEAGGITIWEAAAMGTPTITISNTGTQCNVIHGVTGYIANSIPEMVKYTKILNKLESNTIRKICEERWDFNKNFEKIYDQIILFTKGDRW